MMLQSTLIVLTLIALALPTMRPVFGTAPVRLSACGVALSSPGAYTLTSSLSSTGSCIFINANGITLNCNGNTITGSGPGSGVGIELSGTTGVIVKNCIVLNFDIGIGLFSGGNNILRGNIANNNQFVGIDLASSSGNTLQANSGTGNGLTTGGGAFQLNFHSNNNVLRENTANGNHEGFFLGQDSNNNILGNNTANDNGVTTGGGGFIFQTSNGNTIKENTANSNRVGFVIGNDPIFPSNNNRVIENSACNNVGFDAIQGSTSTGNVFIENNFCSTEGI